VSIDPCTRSSSNIILESTCFSAPLCINALKECSLTNPNARCILKFQLCLLGFLRPDFFEVTRSSRLPRPFYLYEMEIETFSPCDQGVLAFLFEMDGPSDPLVVGFAGSHLEAVLSQVRSLKRNMASTQFFHLTRLFFVLTFLFGR